ncbi:hypothetical protein [Dongia sp.]|uniref:hypothetical protein n=1 Tax=Dongia sp. TaxID=1977262 RepID=UPI0037530C8B
MRLKPTEAVRITRALIRQRMAATAIQQFVREALPEGSIRAGWSDRLLFRRLFFTRQHQRKIVSETAFRLLWPLVRRPSALMPLAEANGIYGFFTARFVSALAGRIDGSCLEIGAGDGALARCLRDAGADIVATDDYSWSGKIDYPPEVQKLPAVEALSQYRPESVLCSWPPGGNPFEAAVFETPSVRRYIVIGSRHQFAFGNWRSYRAQAAFSMQLDEALSGMLLPPDFGGAVYIFDRRSMVV